jgi:hypothetical protein
MTPIDTIKEGAVAYIAKMDKAEFPKWKKKFQEKLNQKVEDSKMTEDAVITQYILDYTFTNSVKLKDGPEKCDFKFILDLARHIALMSEKKFEFNDWKNYEKEITIWGEWFNEVSK